MIKYFFVLPALITAEVFSQSELDYFIKANLFFGENNPDSAIFYLDKAIEISGKPLYYNLRGDILMSKKDVTAALSDYKHSFYEGDNEAAYQIARCFSISGSSDSSAKWLDKYLSYACKLPESTVKTDTAFRNLRKTEYWSDIWKTGRYSKYEIYTGELFYLGTKGKYNEMFDVIDSALAQFPDKPDIWLWRAKAFINENNPKEALVSLDKAIKLNSSCIEGLKSRAGILDKTGKYKKAAEDYNRILEIEPWNIKYLEERGQAKMKLKDYKGAETDFLNYSRYMLYDGRALYNAGLASNLSGDKEKATEHFTACLKSDGRMHECFFERGKCRLDMLDYEKAFSDLCYAIDLNPLKGEYFYYRGLAYYKLGNKAGACSDWEKAKKLNYFQGEQYLLRICANE